MPRKRKLKTISFKNPEQLASAIQKSKNRNRGLSEQIQWHFDNLPLHPKK